jgi:uncharacterized protein YbaR (Trm112 family)
MTLIDPKLLELIRCPVDGQTLVEAGDSVVVAINEQIARRELRDASDGIVEEPVDGILITMDGSRGHAIRGGIPTLIPGESFSVPERLRHASI